MSKEASQIEISTQLERLSAQDRLKWALDNFDIREITATTSGGETSAILLSLLVAIHKSQKLINPFTVVFVDTGLYGQATYDFIEKLKNMGNSGQFEIVTYKPTMSLEDLNVTNPNWSEFGSPDFKIAQYLLKKQPLEQTFTDLGTKLWINGLMRYELPSRAGKPILEHRESGLDVLLPIADWSALKVARHIGENHLPTNPEHYDFFKGPSKGECGMHD